MIDHISTCAIIGMLAKSAPSWFHALENALFNEGKKAFTDKGKAGIQAMFDKEKHRRNVELALQNAAEQGLKYYTTLEERDIYRSVLQLLAEDQNTTLREEALCLFTLSNDPDLVRLNEKYQLSRRVTALANKQIDTQIDVTPYLHSFFSALLAAFYNDPLFREQMSDVIKVRAAISSTQSLAELISIMRILQGELVQDYSPARFQDEICAYMNCIEAKMRYHKFAGIVFHGDEDKAPELENIFEPLRISLPQNTLSKSNTSSDDLSALLEQYPYLVLLGGPGTGKSITTRYLTWSYARNNTAPAPNQAASLHGQFVPLWIELRLFSEARHQLPGCSFLAYTTEVLLRREDVVVSPQMFLQLLEHRAMFLLFDGLDEVSSLNERRLLVAEIETFAQRYPGNHILITSRPIGYELAGFTDPSFQHCQVQDFNDDQIERFLQRWYKYVLKYEILPLDIEHELKLFYDTLVKNERLHKLAINPLLLTVMTALHQYERLPDERVLVYEKCADLLLDIWAKLKYEGTRWKEVKMGKRDQIACLAHLGFFLHRRSQEKPSDNDTTIEGQMVVSRQDTAVDVQERTIYKEIKNFLLDQNLLTGAEQSVEAERFLALVRTEAGLLVSRGIDRYGEQLYGFVHRTFQEYFAAVDVLERYQQEADLTIISTFLAEHIHDPHWHEVILLLLGKLPRKVVTAQLRCILNGENRRSKYADVVKQNLFFISDCLADGITVERDFALNVVSEISQLVKKSPFPSQVDDALSKLGKLLRTRQYKGMGKEALIGFTNDDSSDVVLKIQSSVIIYSYSPSSSKEQHESVRQLIEYGQQPDLSLEQRIQLACAIYNYRSSDSEEEREGVRQLIEYGQRSNLSLEQRIQLAHAIYKNSPSGSKEQREGVRYLIEYGQQSDLSFEQRIQLARAIYKNSPSDSKEQREGVRQLIEYGQRSDLSLEQRIQLTEAVYSYSPSDSKEQHEGRRQLIEYGQRSDLFLEQRIQLTEAVYHNSPSRSEERREGARQLIEYGQRSDLSLEQRIQLTEAVYKNSPFASEEQRNALQTVWQLATDPAIMLEERLRLVVLPCTRYKDNFDERAESVQLLLTLIPYESAKKYLVERWERMPHDNLFFRDDSVFANMHIVASIDSIYKLACQDVLPLDARDAMYKLLREMISLLVL